MGVRISLKKFINSVRSVWVKPIKWYKKSNGKLDKFLNNGIDQIQGPSVSESEKIEALAFNTSQQGDFPLWKGFENLKDYPYPVKNASRNPSQVRIKQDIGNLIFSLTTAIIPESIIEIGSAFGVSGMYWLAALKSNNKGTLYAFEPNKKWAEIAHKNLHQIHSAFLLTEGTFEDNYSEVMKKAKSIDIAFIDAIHVGEIVSNQFEIVMRHANKGSIIIFDDINFSKDMFNCWLKISGDSRVKSSCSLYERTGIVELA